MFLTYKCDISRDNRRVLTLEAREEWGTRGVLVGARILADAEKERQGAGRFGAIVIYINIGPRSMDYVNIMMFRFAFRIFHSPKMHQ